MESLLHVLNIMFGRGCDYLRYFQRSECLEISKTSENSLWNHDLPNAFSGRFHFYFYSKDVGGQCYVRNICNLKLDSVSFIKRYYCLFVLECRVRPAILF